MIRVNRNIYIDEKDLREEFIRASGPGGQNVNKVSTAVQLRLDTSTGSLPKDVQTRLAKLAGNRMTEGGVLIIEANRFRSQQQNRKDAMERLLRLIRRAAERPKPRLKTGPSKASRRRRLESKRRRSRIKTLRKRPPSAEE